MIWPRPDRESADAQVSGVHVVCGLTNACDGSLKTRFAREISRSFRRSFGHPRPGTEIFWTPTPRKTRSFRQKIFWTPTPRNFWTPTPRKDEIFWKTFWTPTSSGRSFGHPRPGQDLLDTHRSFGHPRPGRSPDEIFWTPTPQKIPEFGRPAARTHTRGGQTDLRPFGRPVGVQ